MRFASLASAMVLSFVGLSLPTKKSPPPVPPLSGGEGQRLIDEKLAQRAAERRASEARGRVSREADRKDRGLLLEQLKALGVFVMWLENDVTVTALVGKTWWTMTAAEQQAARDTLSWCFNRPVLLRDARNSRPLPD